LRLWPYSPQSILPNASKSPFHFSVIAFIHPS
jgi:hypothetical protein